MATGLENVSFILIPEKGSAKECSNYHTIALISDTNKVMLRILHLSVTVLWVISAYKAGC